MSGKEQKLVNAQMEVNRAVFQMNQIDNRRELRGFCTVEDKLYIIGCIDSAIADLQLARSGYEEQIPFCPKHSTGGGPCYCDHNKKQEQKRSKSRG